MTTDNARWEAAAENITDEQLAELPDRTRASIEHTRNVGGRPAIGPRVHVAFSEATLEQIDQYAAANGKTRSEAIRALVEIAVWAK